MKVYVITGVAGDYSDRVEWNVKGYLNEDQAKREVQKMDARAREVESELGRDSWYDDDDAEVRRYRKFVGDPYFRAVLSDFPRYHLSVVDIVDLGWPEPENT